MRNNERDVHISVLKTSLIVLAVILAVLFVLKVSQSYIKKMKVSDTTSSVLKSSQKSTKKGIFSLKSTTGRTIFLPGEAMNILLTADSQDTPVSGYDLVFENLDPSITLTDARSLSDSFDVRVVDSKKGWINGGLQLQKNVEGFTFDSLDIAELTFTKSGQGMIDLSVDFKPGETRDSNLMQMNPPQDILAEVQGITLYTGSKMKLATNAIFAFPNTDLSVTLKKVTLPEGLCNDCSTQAHVEIRKGKEVQDLTFLLGGIQGKITDTHEMFGYIFETSSITKEGIEIFSSPLRDTYEKQ